MPAQASDTVVDDITVKDGRALQAEIARLIRRHKATDPFAAVTLVVDSPLSGTLLRRQLVAEGHLGDGACNIRLLTSTDLIAEVADCTGVEVAPDVPRVVRDAVVGGVLAAQPGSFAAMATHPSTVRRLCDTFDELGWCALDPADIARAATAPTTANEVLDFLRRVRAALGALPGGQAKPDLVDAVIAALPHDATPHRLTLFGVLVVVAQHVPEALGRLLDAIAGHVPVHRVRLAPPKDPVPPEGSVPDSIRDCPDPGAEVAFAVRQAVHAITSGVRPEQVAIVYGAENPYAALLATELDRAHITWHGNTVTTLSATALARVAGVVLDMAAGRSATSSGITRPLLLRWIDAAPIYDGDQHLESRRWRRLIRSEGLYDDAAEWKATLQSLANADGAPHEGEDDTESARQRRVQHAQSAESLQAFLDRVGQTLERLATASNWRDLGAQLWVVLGVYHLQARWWQVDPAERQARQRLRELLLDELPALDALAGDIAGVVPAATPAALRQVIDQDLHQQRGRHGDIGAGVYVGSLRTASMLAFEQVIILGAVEGLLPPAGSEDPLLPDRVREKLRRSPADLPMSIDRISRVEDEYRAVVSAAGHVAVTYPRGALPDREKTHPSRYLSSSGPTRVGSSWGSLGEPPWPVTASDIGVRGLLAAGAQIRADLAAPVAAARAAGRSEFDRFHGNLGDGEAGELFWDITSRPLSASAVEVFLHCPYHFFVKRVLGFDTDQIVDEIDEMTARDLGVLLHRALHLFVCAARDDGWLPAHGAAWPDHAEQRLCDLFDAEVAAATAQGRTGWEPSFRYQHERVVGCFAALLREDTDGVRATPPTAPHRSEWSFGGDDDPVTVTLADGTTVRLLGSIDRIDVSADGGAVGIVDYKSGKSKYFREDLGITGTRGKINERKKVQDLVYDVAARTLYPNARQVDVRFVFVPDDGHPTIVPADREADRLDQLTRILTDLRDAGVQGRFALKIRDRDYCPVCKQLGRRGTVIAAAAADGARGAETTDGQEVRS